MLPLKKRDGYTLMELLVVIAIIGVLAALIFPVAATAKRRAQQTKCMNNMFQIYLALKQFQLDEHKYPEFIAGPVQWKSGDRYVYHNTGTIVPLNESTGMINGTNGGNGRAVALYPEYLTVANLVKCPYSDLNGDFSTMNRPYTVGLQGTAIDTQSIVEDPMYNILSTWAAPIPFRGVGLLEVNTPGFAESAGPFSLYKYSSYDYQKQPKCPDPTDKKFDEAHYSPAWAYYNSAVTSIPPEMSRQLRWRTPSETTVVTWCSFHRNVDGKGNPTGGSKDIVLFLDGHTALVGSPSTFNWTQAWLVNSGP